MCRQSLGAQEQEEEEEEEQEQEQEGSNEDTGSTSSESESDEVPILMLSNRSTCPAGSHVPACGQGLVWEAGYVDQPL